MSEIFDLIVDAPGEELDVVGDVRASESLICGEYTVATAPDPAAKGAGAEIYLSNGAAGSPVKAFSDATSWLRCDNLAAISAT